jgi:hypothetical protein
MLPDIIDKPLYYGLSWVTGKQGADLGLISGSRTLGHTALFLLALTSLAMWRKSKVLAALSLGVGSHLLLDSWITLVTYTPGQPPFRYVLLWPFLSSHFPEMPHKDLTTHLHVVSRPSILWCEVIGAAILLWDRFKKSYRLSFPR